MPVADTLVSDHLDIHVLFAVEHTLAVILVAHAFRSVRDKDREVAEIIDVMVDRFYPERTHARDYHRSVERTQLKKPLGQASYVVKAAQDPHREPEQLTGYEREYLAELIELGGVIHRGDSRLCRSVEFLVDLIKGIRRVEFHLDKSLRGIERQLLFDRHYKDDLVTRENFLTAYETVDARALRYCTQIRRKQHMKRRKMNFSFSDFASAKVIYTADLQTIVKGVERITALRHYVGHEAKHRLYRAELAAFPAVAETSLAFAVSKRILLSRSRRICGLLRDLGRCGRFGCHLGSDILFVFHCVTTFHFFTPI